MAPKYKSAPERFDSYVQPDPNSGCWLWSISTTGKGYGQIMVDSKLVPAHRYAWELYRGPIPSGAGYHGICVLHRCDTPACVNPEHLFLGTQRENMADKATKGRQSKTPKNKGERHGQSKLTDHGVRAIRAHVGTDLQIATQLGVSENTVARVRKGRGWVHVV